MAMLLLLVSGCGESDQATFDLNMVTMEQEGITAEQQKDIATVLAAMFGTPDSPRLLAEFGLDAGKIRLSAGPAWSEESGVRHGLYRRHCAHCHGITGDGAGPTASFLNPYPRDYRRGLFKFKSTERAARPTSDDLQRILTDGIPGTAMPSFRLLPTDERESLVEYVKYLSMRGEMETQLINFVVNEMDEDEKLVDEDPPIFVPGREVLVDEMVSDVAGRWAEAGDNVIHPDQEFAPSPDRSAEDIAISAGKGQSLYFDANKGNCFSCHGPSALGDGQTTDFDDWNKTVNEFAISNPNVDPRSLGALPVRNAIPRSLRTGVYRGGRRPVDLYRRLHAGINGTPMPAVGPASPGAQGTLTPEEIWQLVDYVQSLPFEPASQPPPPRASIAF
jgi:mono/diheme cytochrome c family protein